MEHWKTNQKGELEGVYHIDTSKAKGVDMWDKLDQVINEYSSLHPAEMKLHLLEVAGVSKIQANESASTKNKALRWGASIPPGLFFKLQMVEPELFNDKALFHKFMKKYKGFRICQKV